MSPPPSAGEPTYTDNRIPERWQYTWEAQSHTTTLRLLIFRSNTNPSTQCRRLKLHLLSEQFLLIVSFFETEGAQVQTSLRVPVPRVLIDPETPIHFRAFEDHITVKLVLLLPVSHPLVSDVDSILCLDGNNQECLVDSDLKKLSGMDDVHFYCRSCSTKLTMGFRHFNEMPSVNWRDVADNWFGSCCCSFGSVTEKLVTKYVKSYMCTEGVCLLNTTSVLLCKNDILGFEFPGMDRQYLEHELNSSGYHSGNRVLPEDTSSQSLTNRGDPSEEVFGVTTGTNFLPAEEKINENEGRMSENHANRRMNGESCNSRCCPSSNESYTVELLENQRVFLDGFLGNGFMVGSSTLSKDIKWKQFFCSGCMCLVGAYPYFKENVPLDGGIRLFKCCISTCLPSSGLDDVFRNYTLERMFSSQLLESAEDELSFRTIVRDIQTASPVLQITLLNPNSWCCAGFCLQPDEPIAKLCMNPTIQVLFSSYNGAGENDSITLEKWARKNEDEEIYMFLPQLQELIKSLELSNSLYPPSYKSLQGLFLSFLKR